MIQVCYKGQHDDTSNLLFLKSCTNICDYDKGKKIINIIKNKYYLNNRSKEFINTLIYFLCESGDIDNAVNIFNNLSNNKKDIVSLGALMNRFIKIWPI